MKILIKNLKPNPYRDMKKYPIDADKVERLKASIEQTGFWDNLLARQVNSHFELAYGHNRFIALQELGIEEIDIPIKEISNPDMVRIMATENREQWDQTPAIIVETVEAVRDFLNAELAKYDWNDFQNRPDLINLLEQKSEKSFNKTKAGVGQTTILKFLGIGWKQWKIQSALDALDSKDIEVEAFKVFDTTGMAVAFKDEIKKTNKKLKKNHQKPLDKKKQISIAKKVKKQLDETKSINKTTGTKGIAPGKTGGGNYYIAIKDIVRKEVGEIDPYQTLMDEVAIGLKEIEKDVNKLANKIAGLNGKLHANNITELKSVSTLNLINNFSQLLTNTNVLTKTLGIQFNALTKITDHENEN